MTTTPNTDLLAMNQKTYDRVYADCQAGGMNATDCDQIAREHAMTTTPNTKHTPGPWIISPHYQRLASNCVGSRVETQSPQGLPIAIVHGDRDEPGTESIANARLIAAAPDLFAAASDAVAMLESPKFQEWIASHRADDEFYAMAAAMSQRVDSLRAALAKAA